MERLGYDIRPSRMEDVPRMMELFDEARGIMRSDGNMNQWINGYPSLEAVYEDIERGVSYVMEKDGRVMGTFAFIPGIEPTYLRIDGGQWLDDSAPYATIHRLAGTVAGHGIAEACFSWAWQQVPNLRVDTHRDNRIMQHCILKAGFTYCGIIYLANGHERLAYQKIG